MQYAKLSRDRKPVSLTFLEYMAMMSAYKFLRPKKILVHTYGKIEGVYWDRVLNWEGTSVEVNIVDPITEIGGKRVKFITHEADYLKVRGLLEHGGVTSDFDVIVVNGTKLKQRQNMAECVLSRENNYINAGFNSCIRNSSFVRRWLHEYDTDYAPWDWLYNASLKPKYILEDGESQTCHNVYVDGTISMQPLWKYAEYYWLRPKAVQWQDKTAAHYFVKSGMVQDDESLLRKNHSLADILRYVYYA